MKKNVAFVESPFIKNELAKLSATHPFRAWELITINTKLNVIDSDYKLIPWRT